MLNKKDERGNSTSSMTPGREKVLSSRFPCSPRGKEGRNGFQTNVKSVYDVCEHEHACQWFISQRSTTNVEI